MRIAGLALLALLALAFAGHTGSSVTSLSHSLSNIVLHMAKLGVSE